MNNGPDWITQDTDLLHFAGWYMVKELEISSEDVAIALDARAFGRVAQVLPGIARH
jgi:hypothetical protein